ncbi:MAG: toxin-antitoxin system HicB family antitoxin [Geodermatophilaceae bacterium]|nr:toxin-antitoxin system HicB family antitoxin [Geodermatophilaceae bacterium]
MELHSYVEALRHDLQNAAAAGDERTRETARLLSAALDPATRLCLVDAMTAVADEVTAQWDDGAVEIRMRGREPQVVVVQAQVSAHPAPMPPAPPAPPSLPSPPGPDDPDDGSTSRITLRLPEALKNRAERAATAEGLSLNAWLMRAVSTAVTGGSPVAGIGRALPGRRMTGFARG